jgi:hypothetical protein
VNRPDDQPIVALSKPPAAKANPTTDVRLGNCCHLLTSLCPENLAGGPVSASEALINARLCADGRIQILKR